MRELRITYWIRKQRLHLWMFRTHVWPEYPLREQALIAWDFLTRRWRR